MGASFEFPDWVSCADNYCIAGSGSDVLVFTEQPLNQVATLSQTSEATPLEVLTGAGFTNQTALLLLKAA